MSSIEILSQQIKYNIQMKVLSTIETFWGNKKDHPHIEEASLTCDRYVLARAVQHPNGRSSANL